MTGKLQLCCMLATGLLSGLTPKATEAGQAGFDAACGRDVRMRDVLVLDLETFRGQPDLAQKFVEERAGDFLLLNPGIEEIRTRARPSRDPESLIRSARKLGVKKGCDLVLVLKTGSYFGRQRNPNARIRERGYALVVVGRRTAGNYQR